MDIIDQLKLLETGKVSIFQRGQTILAARGEIERLRADLKWATERLRDAVNTCYGGVSHDEIDEHEDVLQVRDTKAARTI